MHGSVRATIPDLGGAKVRIVIYDDLRNDLVQAEIDAADLAGLLLQGGRRVDAEVVLPDVGAAERAIASPFTRPVEND